MPSELHQVLPLHRSDTIVLGGSEIRPISLELWNTFFVLRFAVTPEITHDPRWRLKFLQDTDWEARDDLGREYETFGRGGGTRGRNVIVTEISFEGPVQEGAVRLIFRAHMGEDSRDCDVQLM